MLRTSDSKALLSRLLRLLLPYRKRIGMIMLCILASSCISLFLPFISKEIMDHGLLERRMNTVIFYTMLIFVLVLLDQGIGLVETKYYAYVNSMFSYSLLKTAFKHSLRLKTGYFEHKNPSEVISTISMDVGNVSRICDRGIFILIAQVIRVIGGMAGLLIIDWKLTLLVVGIAPVRYFTIRYLARKRRESFELLIEYSRSFASWFGDTLGGIKEIKLWGLDRIKTGEFIRLQRKIVKMNIRMAFLDKFNEYSESLLFQVINNSLYIVGAYMIFHHDLTIGGLFAFLTYSAYVTGPISAILNLSYSFANVMPSARRLFEFLDTETEQDKQSGESVRLERESLRGRIKFENVSFYYQPGLQILNKANFEIQPGETVVITGVNGSGKSTLIHLLLRFHMPCEGTITLDGIDINKMRLRDYRELIAVVSQDNYLFDTTIEANIGSGLQLKPLQLVQAAQESRAHDFIMELPLSYQSMTGRNGTALSGGQRQKIAMARAFAKDSPILILDEATSHYDTESEQELNDWLAVMRSKGKTILIISHKPHLLKKADRFLRVSNGGVTAFFNYEDFKHLI